MLCISGFMMATNTGHSEWILLSKTEVPLKWNRTVKQNLCT